MAMTLENTYGLQARISALESLVLELLATHPQRNAVAASLEASLAEQHVLQIAHGIQADFAEAFRHAQTQLLDDVRNRLLDQP